jgi:hypothetical protein
MVENSPIPATAIQVVQREVVPHPDPALGWRETGRAFRTTYGPYPHVHAIEVQLSPGGGWQPWPLPGPPSPDQIVDLTEHPEASQ